MLFAYKRMHSWEKENSRWISLEGGGFIKHLGDVTKINGAAIPKVDLITFGAPCQDLSVAGLRKGMLHQDRGDGETTRSGLFFESVRIIKEMREDDRQHGRAAHLCRPRFAVYENVPGAFSSNEGKDFQAVLTEIVRIAEPNAPDVPLPEKGKWPKAGCLYDELANWSVAWRTHDSQWWGVPQRRKRISVLADFSGLTAPEIMFDPQYRRTSEDGKPIETFSDIGTGTRQQVQPFSKGLSGDSEQGGEEREETARGTGNGIEATGKCLNGWDVQSKHIQPADGIAEALYAGECRYAGGESYVFQKAISFQERAGKPGGGKGILIQDEHVGALSTLNNQSVFCIQGSGVTSQNSQGSGINEDVSFTVNALDRHAVAYSFDSMASNSMKSSNPDSGCREVEVSKTLDCFDPNPAKNQGGIAILSCGINGDVAATLDSNYYKGCGERQGIEREVVYDAYQHYGYRESEQSGPLTTDNALRVRGDTPLVRHPIVYNGENITSPINKTNPQSGDPCHTLGADSRNYVVEPICVEMTSTKNTVVEDGVSPTLTARMGTGGNQVNAVCMSMQAIGEYKESNKASALKQRDYKDATDLVVSYQNTTGPLMASGYAKNGTQEAANDMYVVTAVDCRNATENQDINGTLQAKEQGQNVNSNNVCRQGNVVRRLTPLECERLQGYPDGWTDIGEWTDSKGKKHKDADSPRYKALGNSIALPYWAWLLRRISAQYERPATLGSLFSGISGFDLCWTKCNGIGSVLWESEVESFCIAVSTKHFGDEEKGIEGDVAKYL